MIPLQMALTVPAMQMEMGATSPGVHSGGKQVTLQTVQDMQVVLQDHPGILHLQTLQDPTVLAQEEVQQEGTVQEGVRQTLGGKGEMGIDQGVIVEHLATLKGKGIVDSELAFKDQMPRIGLPEGLLPNRKLERLSSVRSFGLKIRNGKENETGRGIGW